MHAISYRVRSTTQCSPPWNQPLSRLTRRLIGRQLHDQHDHHGWSLARFLAGSLDGFLALSSRSLGSILDCNRGYAGQRALTVDKTISFEYLRHIETISES